MGGLLREPLARAAEEAVPLEAVPAGRRAVVVAADRFVVAPLLDLGEDSVNPVPAVPAVSSPERIDSSCWTTSNPSASDMILVIREVKKELYQGGYMCRYVLRRFVKCFSSRKNLVTLVLPTPFFSFVSFAP